MATTSCRRAACEAKADPWTRPVSTSTTAPPPLPECGRKQGQARHCRGHRHSHCEGPSVRPHCGHSARNQHGQLDPASEDVFQGRHIPGSKPPRPTGKTRSDSIRFGPGLPRQAGATHHATPCAQHGQGGPDGPNHPHSQSQSPVKLMMGTTNCAAVRAKEKNTSPTTPVTTGQARC